jgi:hypothetical protein
VREESLALHGFYFVAPIIWLRSRVFPLRVKAQGLTNTSRSDAYACPYPCTSTFDKPGYIAGTGLEHDRNAPPSTGTRPLALAGGVWSLSPLLFSCAQSGVRLTC